VRQAMTGSRGRLRAAATQPQKHSAASTKDRIIAAAAQTLREEGFAGTSARSIARRGDFNQALIFYHFGSVLDLLIAVLETMSSDRLAQYRAAIAEVPDLRSALATARSQYAIDVREGHITVLVELVAGASSAPQLGPEIVRCMEPWIGFAEESIARFLGDTPLAAMIPTREAAHALLAIYLGMEMLDHLDPDAGTADPLFRVAERMLAAVEPFLGVGGPPRAARRPRRVPIEAAASPSPRRGDRSQTSRTSA
jgi:AcrR family transcriptional regulator